MTPHRLSFALAAIVAASSLPIVAHAGAGSPADMFTTAANASSGSAHDNLAIYRDIVKDFGATCNGSADDTTALAAATTWINGGASNRVVMINAGLSCTSTQIVTLGNGRQQSTALSANAANGASSVSVASCAGIQNGDNVTIVLNSGTYRGTAGTCAAGSLPISPNLTGGANSGNLVYTGKASSFDGGGFRGMGPCNELNGAGAVSTIKYTGSAAPTTTTTATVSSGQTIAVAANTGISLGTPLKITLDNTNTFFTMVTQTPSGLTINIANEVPSTITSGATVTILNNPVVRIAGPINAPMLDGLCLDANSLAAEGLDAVSVVNGRMASAGGISAINYSGIGGLFRSLDGLVGAVGGSVGSDIAFSAYSPANNRTIGAWTYGPAAQNMAYSRNRFRGGTLTAGGHDAAAAALREEHVDNNTFLKLYTQPNNVTGDANGAGLYRQPSVGVSGLGTENNFYGGALKGGVVLGTATGGVLGQDFHAPYHVGDGEPVPTDGYDFGFDTGANLFGVLSIRPQGGSLLSQRNGTTAQQHRVYNTYTDLNNGEWGDFSWSGNVLYIGTDKNGTGASRNIALKAGGTTVLDYGITNAGSWSVLGGLNLTSGSLLFNSNTSNFAYFGLAGVGTFALTQSGCCNIMQTDASRNLALNPTNGHTLIGTTTDSGLQAAVAGSGLSMTTGALATQVANAGVTGTTLNKLAKLTGAPSTAVITATTDTDGGVGVVVAGAGTTGNAQIAIHGQASCIFDGATTAGDWVGYSTTTAGDCHDAGATRPTHGIGRVLSTNAAGGTYAILVAPF